MLFHCTCSTTLKCKLSCSLTISRASWLSPLLIWFLFQYYWYATRSLCYFHLHDIYRLCPFPALVTSHLDYCNVILSRSSLRSFFYPQNSLMNSKWDTTDHITPIPIQLYWLPIPQIFVYKILLLTFKVLNDLAPPLSVRPPSPLHMLYAQHHPDCSWLQT